MKTCHRLVKQCQEKSGKLDLQMTNGKQTKNTSQLDRIDLLNYKLGNMSSSKLFTLK